MSAAKAPALPEGMSPIEYLEETERELLARIEAVRADKDRLLGHAGHTEWLSYRDALRRIEGAKDRISTGMPGLDRRIDGGLHRGSLTIVQGRPGIGKSLFTTQIGRGMAPNCAVSALYADEGLRGAAITIGQQLGLQKALIERCHEETTAEAIRRLTMEAPDWQFLDPQSPRGTLETLLDGAQRLSDKTGKPPLLIVDSIQTVRSRLRNPKAKMWENVTVVLGELREQTLARGAITLVVSKVTRASYAHKDDSQNSEEIAAGAGGADLEFMCDLMLHLKGERNADQVTLRAAKNRLSGDEFDMPLLRDRPRKAFLEVETEPEPVVTGDDPHQKALHDSIIEFVRRNPDCLTRLVTESVPGKTATIHAALKDLRQKGLLFSAEGARGSIRWYLPKDV